jgi:DNA-directed RNA polymerase subunit RPC12/RpoP
VSYQCVMCRSKREVWEGPMTETLDPAYLTGRCSKCGMTRMFRRLGVEPTGAEAARQRREGETRAVRSSKAHDPAWAARFESALRTLASQHEPFTSEDVTDICGLPALASGSAVGARVSAAARRGIIVWTGEVRTATTPNTHGALLKIWRGA